LIFKWYFWSLSRIALGGCSLLTHGQLPVNLPEQVAAGNCQTLTSRSKNFRTGLSDWFAFNLNQEPAEYSVQAT